MNHFRWNGIFALFLLLLHFAFYTSASLRVLTMFGNLTQALALMLSAWFFGRAASKAEPSQVSALNSFALGFWICLMGHLLLAYSELLLNKPATATVTDAIWLIGYSMIARAFVLMTAEAFSKTQLLRLYSLLVFVCAAIVCIVLWGPLRDTERDLPTKFVQVIFPFLDLFIAAIAFVVAHHTTRKIWFLAAFGWLLIGITDLVFPFFYERISTVYRTLDIPLFVGYSAFWLTSVHLASTVASRRTTQASG